VNREPTAPDNNYRILAHDADGITFFVCREPPRNAWRARPVRTVHQHDAAPAPHLTCELKEGCRVLEVSLDWAENHHDVALSLPGKG
jgi:hypothetical protein